MPRTFDRWGGGADRVTDTKDCEQCGTMFTPRREHGRFCSARCRMDWHGQNPGDRTAEMSALGWSLAAMCEATGRLSRVQAWDRPRACWAVGDAVWWVTIVDATLVRHHPEAYDCVLARRATAERRLIEDTLAGLRFVRNQMGSAMHQVYFVRPGAGPLDPGQRVSGWFREVHDRRRDLQETASRATSGTTAARATAILRNPAARMNVSPTR
jgi:hypothetical protein